jgi:predicted glutamine amidotransferase
MCGIFGMISKKAKPFNKRAFCTMGARNDSRGGDSCGVFVDGLVEYGVDKMRLFISFFRESLILETVKECKVALGHCRKASVGNVSIETAQPVVLYNEKNEIDYVLIHNGTIYNYQELAKKYIPEIDIQGLTDSQVMARIFYHSGYEVLDEYQGGAVFVIHDYRIDKSFVFKGSSKKYSTSANQEEERPLYYCWHNGRFVFSSIFETLYAFYYEETIYSLPCNKLFVIRNDKLKTVHEYKREKVLQSKPVVVHQSTYPSLGYGGSYWDDLYTNADNFSYKVKYNGMHYLDERGNLMHGIVLVSSYGWVKPNAKVKESWQHRVAFYKGRLLKHPEAFTLIEEKLKEANGNATKETDLLINMLDFNPFSEDGLQHYWYDGDKLMVPQNEWKWPMADFSCKFDENGMLLDVGQSSYQGWVTDYNMYTFERDKVVEDWLKLCAEE